MTSTILTTTDLTFKQTFTFTNSKFSCFSESNELERVMNFYNLIHSKTLCRKDDENNEEYADRCWVVWKKLHENAKDGVIELKEHDYDETECEIDEETGDYKCEDYEEGEFGEYIQAYIQDCE